MSTTLPALPPVQRFIPKPMGTFQPGKPSAIALTGTNLNLPPAEDRFIRQAKPAAMPALLPAVSPTLKQNGYSALSIVYNNDPHEKFKALPHLVSAFRLISRQAQQTGRDVLRLNSGDNNVGKEPEEWGLQVRLLNLLNYHAVTMGNHELDLGTESYAKGLQHANFPTLLSNLKVPAGSPMARLLQTGRIRTLPQVHQGQNGKAYGIIGVTTPELKSVVSTKAKLGGETPQSFAETAANVKAQVDWLRAQGINQVIVLSHMGNSLESKLAQTVPGIDVIMGGHSHDVLDGVTPGKNYLSGPTGEPVLILQGGKNAEYMGVADVLFDPQGRIIPQQNKLFSPTSFPADPQALALRDAILGRPQKIADMRYAYNANNNEFHADPVAQFSADAIRAASNADIAFVRSAEIRNNYEAGPFTDHDLKALMPFTDPMVRLNLSGKEIMDSLSRSTQALRQGEHHPGLLHASGMVMTLNRQTGQVQQAYVYDKAAQQWRAMDPQKQYQVAMGEFTVQNREFPELSHPERIQWNSGQPLRAFFNWGLHQAAAGGKPVNIQDDGRLQII